MDGLDWVGWYPGGRGYRAPYGANKNVVDCEISWIATGNCRLFNLDCQNMLLLLLLSLPYSLKIDDPQVSHTNASACD